MFHFIIGRLIKDIKHSGGTEGQICPAGRERVCPILKTGGTLCSGNCWREIRSAGVNVT